MRLPSDIADMLAAAREDARRSQVDHIKKDPKANKLTGVFEGDIRYLYYPAGKDGLKREIRFCYTTVRNAAGYFLSFREVLTKKGGKRDQFAARKVRKRAAALAKGRAERFKERRAFGDQATTRNEGA